jgi:hypothetical protein
MGCDIHFYVETRHADGTWRSADRWFKDEDDGQLTTFGTINGKWTDTSLQSGRCYALFAMLANVRNGDFEPVAPPRGVPADASAEYKAVVDAWDCDGHSHSHLTLAELLAYDWTQTAQRSGVVNIEEWATYHRTGKPTAYSGAVWSRDSRVLDTNEFEAAWNVLQAERPGTSVWDLTRNDEVVARFVALLDGGPQPYCTVTWTEPYYACAGSFWSETMPRLVALGKPEDVRCVFFFDN